jgi:hypothetical protein
MFVTDYREVLWKVLTRFFDTLLCFSEPYTFQVGTSMTSIAPNPPLFVLTVSGGSARRSATSLRFWENVYGLDILFIEHESLQTQEGVPVWMTCT